MYTDIKIFPYFIQKINFFNVFLCIPIKGYFPIKAIKSDGLLTTFQLGPSLPSLFSFYRLHHHKKQLTE